MLLTLIKGLDKSNFTAVIVLPRKGPLYAELVDAGIEVHIVPLLLVSRSSLTPLGLVKAPFQLVRSLLSLLRLFRGRKFDAVHSNTLAVLSGAFYAKLIKVLHVWHVHEIIIHPQSARAFFPLILLLLADKVACNSNATLKALLESQPALFKKAVVIMNGVEPHQLSRKDLPVGAEIRQRLKIGPDTLLVAMVGRVNRLKGQRLLVDAAEIAHGSGLDKIFYLMVGSAPDGQEEYLNNLRSRIDRSPISNQILLMKFEHNIWPVWEAADIAVVPSTEPESFGMVALEAMTCGKPVIAAAHGGLLDVVINGETGILVEPGNGRALADAIKRLAVDLELRRSMGSAGAKRSVEEFSLTRYVRNFEQLYLSLSAKEIGPQCSAGDFDTDVVAKRDT